MRTDYRLALIGDAPYSRDYIRQVRDTISPYVAAGWAMIDDVIEPADTRRVIVKGLEQARDKKVERPWRKHGNIPV